MCAQNISIKIVFCLKASQPGRNAELLTNESTQQ